MKPFCSKITLTICISSLLLFAGCAKKTVIPPSGTAGGNSTLASDGKNINYPMAQNDLPREGSLDDSTGYNSGNASSDYVDIENQSDEYKRTHGRCSAHLAPIYFEFDQAGIKPEMQDILIVNADYLHSLPRAIVRIEGNSDERGTSEYNLALGERRAINTQQYLVNLGVDPLRIKTVSYGEEKPLFYGQDEDSYKYNRRVDFVLE